MLYVGIDVSKNSFNFCVVDSKDRCVINEGSLPYSKEGFSSLCQVLNSLPSDSHPVIVMESSGRFHIPLFVFLCKAGFDVRIVNPKVIRRFSDFYSSSNPSKSDKKDAFLIALLASSQPELVSSSPDVSPVRFLAREIERIKQEISQCKTEIRYLLSVLFPEAERMFNVFSYSFLSVLSSFPSAPLIAQAGTDRVNKCFQSNSRKKGRKPSFSAEDIVTAAKNSIGISNAGFEASLKFHIEKLFFLISYAEKLSKLLTEEVKRFFPLEVLIVSSIPGISPELACRFIAELGDVRRFDSWKKIVKYAGTDPVVKQSGKMVVKGGISKQGNPHLRNVLFQMAVGVVKWCPKFREYFKRKFSQFGSYKKAMVAVMNKLVRVLFAMLSKGQCFCHSSLSPELISDS